LSNIFAASFPDVMRDSAEDFNRVAKTEMSRIAVQSEIPFVEYDLENGLHVILAESHAVPLVAVNLWYHVGSKDENPDRTGFAHLFEHLMFQGSANVEKVGHFKYIQNAGGTLNATTNQDRTNYFETLPSSHLGLALWLESDRMLSLNVSLENFENQRAVVKEERRQRYDNQPYGLVYEELLKNVFPSSGYHWSTIGSMQHLDEASLDEVVAFHRKYYVPNNASLAIAGDFNVSDAKALIQQFFGSIPKGETVVRMPQIIAPILNSPRPVISDGAKLPSITIAFQVAPAFTASEYALDVASSILGAGKSSRLYRTLVRENRMAKEVRAYNISSEQSGMFMIDVMLQSGVSLAAAEETIWREIRKLKSEPVLGSELEKAQNRDESHFIRSVVELARRADQLQRAYIFTGDTNRYAEAVQAVRMVTADDLMSAAQRFFTEEACVVLTDMPKGS
jgi:predicted Zn-dependent peptidase